MVNLSSGSKIRKKKRAFREIARRLSRTKVKELGVFKFILIYLFSFDTLTYCRSDLCDYCVSWDYSYFFT